MTIAFIFVAGLLLIGKLLRERVGLFRWLHIPVSVIAGLVGLTAVQAMTHTFEVEDPSIIQTTCEVLASWPSWLIAVVFAGMLLSRNSSSASESARRVAAQGVMVWVIVLGETAVGLLVTWLLIQPFFDVPNSFGMLIETGFAGGHGTAAAMGDVFAHPSIQLESGRDLGMLMATLGLVYGIVTGIFWINIGVRKGWVPKKAQGTATQLKDEPGLDRAKQFGPDVETEDDGFDRMLLQVIWLALAFGLGMLAQHFVMQAADARAFDYWASAGGESEQAQRQLSKRLSVSNVVDFPLFVYTLFGGLFIRRLVSAVGKAHWIDGRAIGRLTGAAMDILVVAAIATLNLGVVIAMAGPFFILFVAGSIWAAICLLLISRWLLPSEHWFQLALINYGMSTGTTATGFVLLKVVDPELKSDAAGDYALAAPLSAPFVGGGIITIGLPLLVLERISIAIPAIVISAIVIGLIFVGRRITK